jgi:hypothetical protein
MQVREGVVIVALRGRATIITNLFKEKRYKLYPNKPGLNCFLPDLFIQGRGKNKVIEFFILRMKYLILITFPPFVPLEYENNLVANFHNRIHIMRINNGRDIKLKGNLLY